METVYEKFLGHIAYNLRISSILSTTQAGSGHPTSCLSIAEIMAVVFFHAMQFDPRIYDNPNNDRFILSKGHAAPILYAVWKELGLLSQEDLLTLRAFGSPLEGHPVPKFVQSEAATGSLGQGLSIGVGMAQAAHMDNRSYKTYVVLGDSELAEGSVWEAAEIAAYYRLNNLIAVLDINRLGQSTDTIHGHNLSQYVQKFTAFGWQTYVVDGHAIGELISVLDKAQRSNDRPVVIIAKTYKGFGVAAVENKPGYHGRAFSKTELPNIFSGLQKRFAEYAGPVDYSWSPKLPQAEQPAPVKPMSLPAPDYAKGHEYQTRRAYGEALVQAGGASPAVVSLDAEVKNSTFAYLFEQVYPARFVQCFIAEQNMVGMGVGMAARNKIPFISTFGAFFTRAYDQIRMAAIGRVPLRLVGSHAGVSIGQDGPSQMALEDIAMMRAIPDSVVLYPCDAVSTWWLVGCMANYTQGISYLRTTRSATPVRYASDETFEIGGCKVLHQSENDQVCVVAAGITVSEAEQAYYKLVQENIFISVIDAYSIKPLDIDTIRRMGVKGQRIIITVEDHYVYGGLGEAVAAALCNDQIQVINLAVRAVSSSGTPEKLRTEAGIDARAIIQRVQEYVTVR